MNVLVTGGAGFIGSHLADRLVGEGHYVLVFDNEATGRRENVAAAAHYIQGDVTRPADLERAFGTGLDAVCHIAGQVSLIRSFTDPVIDLRTNVEGTVNVLQLCLKYRVPRLYVRTTAERVDLGFDFHVTCFRMYNVYGPRQALDNPYQGVLGIFLGNLLRGEPLTIFGDGEQSRDFVYIDDIVDAWVGALGNPVSYGGIFNLGSGCRLSINQLADHVLIAFGRKRADDTVVYAPGRPGEQRQVEADITQARASLGWEPKVPFAAGLAETVRWAEKANIQGS